LSDK